jgi:hypothetical protein
MSEGGPLEICMGSKEGASFNVRSATPVAVTERRETVLVGKLAKWARVLVKSTGIGGSTRLWILEPGDDDNEIAFGEFHVRGRFKVADKSNNPRKVEQLWKRTPPA